ncbi:MAG TPA: DUF2938 family protein, partial [Steroidobacteraceae bacterium]|nr:DUF2938 family protein [Steroidobacteraceae bacterium]
MNYLIETLIVGLVATAVMDVWGVVRKPLLGLPAADYRLVGRWIAYFARGKFRHESIAKAPALSLEQLIGWAAHYLLGMVFAAGLLAVTRPGWIQRPTLGPALIFGVLTVAVPFLVMQPA